jgi:hypothetical protein
MLKQVIEVHELLDEAGVDGASVSGFLRGKGLTQVSVNRIDGEKGSTDFVKIFIPGAHGKSKGGTSPTLGIIGRLGGLGARPERIGLVSDADGAIVALSCAAKLAEMARKGDGLPGDVIVATHICPRAPTQAHEPVPFMGSPVDMKTMNTHEVDPVMDAILSIDTTKGNRILNCRGFAVSPTVKEGFILKVSEDILDIVEWSTGCAPRVLPITMQDITPYGNGLFHLNSILQPCTATTAPVIGVAITTCCPVPGCATGASRETDIEETARFCIEVAKSFTGGRCRFFVEEEFERIRTLYGPMSRLQTMGAARRTPKIGGLTIGQSPRVDVLPDFLGAIDADVEVIQCGALDNLTTEEIRKLAPGGDDDILVTRLRDGVEVTLSERLILDRMKGCVRELEKRDVELIVLFCTGEFPDLEANVPLLRPNVLLERIVSSLAPRGRLCAVVPSRDQIPAAAKKWSRSGWSTCVESVSPYVGTADELRSCAERVARLGCDLVVLDCIGYSGEVRALFRKIVDKPVILPRSLLGSIAREMLGV